MQPSTTSLVCVLTVPANGNTVSPSFALYLPIIFLSLTEALPPEEIYLQALVLSSLTNLSLCFRVMVSILKLHTD